MRLFFVLCNITMNICLFAFSRWQVEGKENVPQDGPLIIVSNHLSMADPPLIGASIPRRVIFMAKEELFVNWFTRFVCENYGSFPVKRDQLDGKAIRTARELLEDGGVLGMFPEGKRSPNGQLQSAEAGAALIASHATAPILPVGISGTDNIKGLSVIFRRPHIKVTIGQPFTLPEELEHKPSRQKLGEYTDIIMDRISELLPDSYKNSEIIKCGVKV